MEKMYFGRPISFYDVPIEREMEEAITKKFPNFILENPNKPEHQQAYQKWRKEKGNGMQYYFTEVLPNMAAGTFLAFPEDKMIGAGVWGEAEFINSCGKPIYEIDIDLNITPLVLDISRKLSVEDTRKRIYGPNGLILKWID